jgi:fructoselysine 6-kinase
MVRVVGVGDNTVDRYAHLGRMFPGGNAVNVPVLAHRYGHLASYIGWLGNDQNGRLILDALREEGIDVSRCRVVDGPTSYSTVALVDGDRVFGAASHGVTDQLALDADDLSFVRHHDLAHTSIYSYVERDLPRLHAAAPALSFDFSSDWTRDYLAEMLPFVDIAFLSHPPADVDRIVELIGWAKAHGPRLVVVTLGMDGAFASDGGPIQHQGIVPTEVVDTLGAGDAFAARPLVEHLGGASLQASMAAAAEAAAATCTYYGAFGHGAPYDVPSVAAHGDAVGIPVESGAARAK